MYVGSRTKFFITISVFFFITIGELHSYHIRNYSDKDGLSMNIGASIVQDRYNYIWIGTQGGLNRFDGVDVKIFTDEQGLPDNYINDLCIDNNKNLWVATRGGLARYNYEDKKFKAYKEKENTGLIHNHIRCLAYSKKYGLLIGTAIGLTVLKDGQFIDYTKKNHLFKNKLQAIKIDEKTDKIYLGTIGEGLITYHDGIPIQIKEIKDRNKPGDKITINNIKALLLDKEGLWIATDEILTLFQNGNFVKTFNIKGHFGITNLLKDKRNNFWIATTDGLYRKSDNKILKDKVSFSLAGKNIISLFEDHEAGLWIGAHGGVSHLMKSKFSTYSKKDGLPENVSFGLYEDNKGKIWVATYGGIAVIDDRVQNNPIIKTYTPSNSDLPSTSIRTITSDKDGNIWIGALAGGLIKYKNGEFETYNDGFPNKDVRVVYVDSKDNLWLGMKEGGLVLFDKRKNEIQKIYNTRTTPKLLNDNIWFIKEDLKKNLWIGMDGGISHFDLKSEKFVHYSKSETLECDFAKAILEDGGAYWIATLGNGLYYKKDDSFKQYTTKNGLPDNYIYGLIKDNDGWLWLPTNKGVCRFNKKDKYVTYTVKDGLPSNECNAHGCLMDSRGRIWFSTAKGVAWIDPENVHKNGIPPPVYIEQLKVDKKTINFYGKSKITLDPNPQNIYIKFTALSYQFPEGVKFKIRLDGFHKPDEWFEPLGNNRFVEYTNLPPGDYAFRVKAANSDGVWNEEVASLDFTIKPSFFQTIWFYVALVIVILALIAGYIRYRTAQQRRRQKELKRRVEERTRELKETEVQLIQQGKMASLGEMAAGLAHEMNNPANYIYGNADYLQKYIEDVKSVLIAYMKLDLPEDHKIRKIREERDIDKKLEELGGLVKYVKEGATRISDIVSDLRFFVGKDEPELQKVDIHKNIETTLNLLHNKTKNRIEIEKYYGDISLIEGSSGQLNQAFMNILSNAADAIPEKGIITVETIFKGDQKIMIKISDTGEGIKNENLSRIFDPFFTSKTKERGMGLGLSITKKIVERHNGSIDVESEVGKGTVFIITLPVKQETGET